MPLPGARRRTLVLRELLDETLVYDMASHRASCLNRGAGCVLQACNGRRSLREIAEKVSRDLGQDVDEAYVGLAVARLEQADLIVRQDSPASPKRRDLLRRVAATATIALPAVTSVLAPEAAQAQTCLANDSACTTSAQCCSGCCMASGGMAPECAMGMGNCI